jgi:hypothetical protein
MLRFSHLIGLMMRRHVSLVLYFLCTHGVVMSRICIVGVRSGVSYSQGLVSTLR